MYTPWQFTSVTDLKCNQMSDKNKSLANVRKNPGLNIYTIANQDSKRKKYLKLNLHIETRQKTEEKKIITLEYLSIIREVRIGSSTSHFRIRNMLMVLVESYFIGS